MRSMPVILRRTSDRNDHFRFRMEALIPARSPGPRLQLLHATLVDNLLDMNFRLYWPCLHFQALFVGLRSIQRDSPQLRSIQSCARPRSHVQRTLDFGSRSMITAIFSQRKTSAKDQDGPESVSRTKTLAQLGLLCSNYRTEGASRAVCSVRLDIDLRGKQVVLEG